MLVHPHDSRWTDYYFKKIIDLPQETSLILPNSRDEIINKLKFWNKTSLNNANSIDVVLYEQLIYFEIFYKNDEEIQLLVQILKEKIANNYRIKAALIDNLVDKDIFNDIDFISTYGGERAGI